MLQDYRYPGSAPGAAPEREILMDASKEDAAALAPTPAERRLPGEVRRASDIPQRDRGTTPSTARWRPFLAVLLIALAIGAGGWWYLQRGGPAAAGILTLYGNVDIREVQPAFNSTGQVTAMLVHEGAVVKQGQLLATLDDTRYAAALAQAKGQMENQKQVLDRVLAGSRPEEIAQAKATMDALQTTYQNNETTAQRFEFLAPKGAATIQQRDDARAAAAAAQKQYEAAKQAYTLAVKGPRVEDIAAARASYEAAVAAVALAQRQFDDTRLYAPSAGVVEDRILEPGDMASPSTPVFTIALTSPLWVRAYVPESRLGHIRLGMLATIATDSYEGRVYHGWVGYLSPASEFTPKTVETPELRTALVYQVRVYVCDARGELRLGMPATVHIDLQAPPSAAPGCEGPDAGNR
jgi:membrane fusion protein YbhG